MDDQVPGRAILAILAATVAFSVLLCVLAWRLLVMREAQLHYHPEALGTPHDVADIRSSLFDSAPARPAIADAQRRSLAHYGWVDRSRRLIRIPVDREIDLMLREAQP